MCFKYWKEKKILINIENDGFFYRSFHCFLLGLIVFDLFSLLQ